MNSSAQFLLAIFLSGVSISTRAQVPSTAPAKKVWTNDDLRTLRDSSGVSTVVPAKNSTVKNGDAPRKPICRAN